LIKVGDNGPLSATAKVLSDGLGNDSPLSMSTTLVGIGTTTPSEKLEIQNAAAGAGVKVSNSGGGFAKLAVSSNASSIAELSFTNSLGITGGNVGIGLTDPTATLTVKSPSFNTRLEFGTETNGAGVLSFDRNASAYKQLYLRGSVIQLNPNDVNRVSVTSDGLTFNGDTASANALDDYEEGDWTMGVSFGNASVGVTTSSNTGTYTKIGRQVTVNGLIVLTSKGSSTGVARITGLPFVIGGSNKFAGLTACHMENVTFTGQIQPIGAIGDTVVVIQFVTELGVNNNMSDLNFSNTTRIAINYTYFV
jgi:hypothetical protein